MLETHLGLGPNSIKKIKSKKMGLFASSRNGDLKYQFVLDLLPKQITLGNRLQKKITNKKHD